jgi:hypothetical protein
MPRYSVEKRIINNYLVQVDANSPEEAILAAYNNNHEPGEISDDNESGDTFYPSEWRVYSTGTGSPGCEELPEINFGIDRVSLQKLD